MTLYDCAIGLVVVVVMVVVQGRTETLVTHMVDGVVMAMAFEKVNVNGYMPDVGATNGSEKVVYPTLDVLTSNDA